MSVLVNILIINFEPGFFMINLRLVFHLSKYPQVTRIPLSILLKSLELY